MRRKQAHAAEREGAIGQHWQHRRYTPNGAGGRDSAIGRLIGEPERLRAIGKERRVAELLAQVPSLDLD